MRIPLLLALGLIALTSTTFGGCPRNTGPEIGRLPTVTTDDPEAEAALRDAQALESMKDTEGATQAYEAFIRDRGKDPLIPIAQLALGRLRLRAGEPREALALFDGVAAHSDQAIAEQGRFYGAVARHRLGEHEAAAKVLSPMVGRTIAPEDTLLLLETLASARTALGDHAGAISALDTLLGEPLAADARRRALRGLADLVDNKASPEEIAHLHRELPRDGTAWPRVVRRAVQDADAAGDVERARRLLEVMRDEELPIDERLASIAMRAERPADAAPNVVGAVLSLSGRARKVGELALRGVMLSAGLPPKSPPGPGSPQVIFRDDGGDPQRAVEAVNELGSVHRVIAIIGPMDGRAGQAAAARAQELGVPIILLTASGQPTRIGPMVHRLFPTPSGEVRALLAHAQRSGRGRVAALLPEGGYGDLMLETLGAEAARAGLQLVGSQRYSAGATSFGKTIAELAKLEFDALMVADSSKQTALIAPALAAAGVWSTAADSPAPGRGRGVLLMAPSVAFDPSLASSVGRYLQGAVFSLPFDASTERGGSKDFAQRFQAQFQQRPDAFAAFAHDAYAIIRRAVDTGAQSREDLAEALVQVRLPKPAGPSRGLLSDREAERPTQLITLQGERFAPLP